MLPYPEEDVDRIIGEAVANLKPDDNTGWCTAFERIATLLLERIVSAWTDGAAQRALRSLVASEARIRRFNATRPCLLKMSASQSRTLADTLELCVQAIGACQAARPAWAIAGHGEHEDIAMVIADYAQAWDDRRMVIRKAQGGRGLLVHTSFLEQVHEGLQICFLLFMTDDESRAFAEHLNRAIRGIVETMLVSPALGNLTMQ